eukprot:TRINITY_DN65624_c0_g1_i1.p3 TRINITY_DN65624_c0_g1~~TRINITY_DN65624_c0_g1_i1.p3  ORF type:complete len:133 (-),score=8.27 TRINITY_DN65624_c0_g1_i1:166-564(-)
MQSSHTEVGDFLAKIAAAGKPDGLSASILWRLVKKKRLEYYPGSFGARDRYQIKFPDDIARVRQKICHSIEDDGVPPTIRDQLLAFLYYLPKNATDKIFAGYDDLFIDDVKAVCWSVAKHVREKGRLSRTLI